MFKSSLSLFVSQTGSSSFVVVVCESSRVGPSVTLIPFPCRLDFFSLDSFDWRVRSFVRSFVVTVKKRSHHPPLIQLNLNFPTRAPSSSSSSSFSSFLFLIYLFDLPKRVALAP